MNYNKIFFAACILGLHASCDAPKQANTMEAAKAENKMQTSTIHDFSVEALNGGRINFADFKGKKILVVNTASECGYTPQYKGLQELYENYKDKLVVVGFPANNFGGQEPGSNAEIAGFCQKNYGVTFPMAAKVSVKGADVAPVYTWLTHKDKNGVLDAEVKWNFNKFLLDENGHLLKYFPSSVEPVSEEIISLL